MEITKIDILNAARAQWNADDFGMLPGMIESYNPVTQRADIQPLLRRPITLDDGSIVIDELDILPNVGVRFTRGGGYFQSIELAKGDPMTLFFCDQSIDTYESSASIGKVEVDDLRTKDINDAIAFPGWYPFAKPIIADIQNGIVIGKVGGVQIHIVDDTVEVTTSGSPVSIGGYVALATKVDAFIQAFHVVMTAWTPVATDGGAVLKSAYTAAFAVPPVSTASTNLKAD